jgi:two-component system, sensor histidine kinase and response regulator
MAEPDVIDRATLESLLETVGGDADFLGEMIDAYFEDTPQLLEAMRRALATASPVELRRAAHSLKSNSTNFGALALAGLCKDLEERGSSGALDGAAALVAQVEAEYERVKLALDAARPQ